MTKSFLCSVLIMAFLVMVTEGREFDKRKINRPASLEELNNTRAARVPLNIEQWPDFGQFKGGPIWWESFETPRRWAQWTAEDLTVPRPEPIPSQWLLDDWQAYEGLSWRCADLSFGNNGGYGNHWYQVLDTPPLQLDEDAVFSFYHRFAVENPAGAPAPYDAWDGLNVRISVDGGETWQVLSSQTYNVSSIWAFGEPQQGHNEGPGIPGWAGLLNDWTDVSFDLSTYTSAENPVILRFAFASDMAYSTVDGDPDLFGWQIDQIIVKSANKIFFANNGVDEGLTGKSNEFIPPPGGNLWHVVKFQEPLAPFLPEFEPHGNHSAAVQNSGYFFDPNTTYNPYMDNIFYTGPISLPDVSPIYLDFKYIPNFFDAGPFPNMEFFRPEVRHADSTFWEPIEAQPYVYTFGFNRWLEFAWTYGYPINTSMFDLSRFAGQDIYLSFRFWSDFDQPQGYGLLIDDVIIYSPTRELPPPQNVQAEPNREEGAIVISWADLHEEVVYTIGRKGPGDRAFFAIAQVKGETEFYDYEIQPYLDYQYIVLAQVQYVGKSPASKVVSASLIPEGVIELAYDDSEPNGFLESAANRKVAVRFTPQKYPVRFSVMKVYLNTQQSTGTAGRFSILASDDQGMPGNEVQFRLRSGLIEGFNVIEFSTPLTVENGHFYVSFQRFGTSPYVAIDTDPPVYGNTFLETDTGWVNILDSDAMFHVFLDTTVSEQAFFVSDLQESQPIPREFMLYNNYPNPFNPNTTISFNVPVLSAQQQVLLEVFDILGQRVITLFDGPADAGRHSLQWNGLNQNGEMVPSGIYFYRLQSEGVQLSKRMLLIK